MTNKEKNIEKDIKEIMDYIKDLRAENQKQKEILDQLKEILSMDYLVRVYGYDMAKRLQTYLKSNDIVKRWLNGKD